MTDFDRLLGDSLKAIRDEHVRQIEPEVFAARQRIDHKLRGRRVRFVVGGTAVAAAALAAFVFVSQTLPKVDRATPIQPAGETVIVNRIDVPGVGDIEPGLGALWVAHPQGLVGIDPLSGRITTESPVRPVEHMSFNDQAMYAIDSSERGINRIPFGSNEAAIGITIEATPTRVAASDDAVWVAADVGPDGFSQVSKLSPDDLAMQESIDLYDELGIKTKPGTVADMTHAGDALWMSIGLAGDGGFEVRRFSDDGAESGWTLSADEGAAADIVVGEGSAWVLRQGSERGGNTITRIDLELPEANERLATVESVDESAVSFLETIESIAVGEGYLWVTTAPTGMNMAEDGKASLHRIDPETLQPVGEPLEVGGPGSQIEVGSGFVWVADPNANQIVQIDPSGDASPQPEPSETPTATETRDSEEDDNADADLGEAFAIWPEATPEEAAANCSAEAGRATAFRQHPESVAVVFADELLGWDEVVLGKDEVIPGPGDLRAIEVQREPSTNTPRVDVTLREVAEDCWSVSSVRTIKDRIPDDAPTGVSVSSVDGVVEVTFEPGREAAGHEVSNIRLIVGSKELVRAADIGKVNTISLTRARSGEPDFYLVLLEGPGGEVVGALGGALPAGDFTAG